MSKAVCALLVLAIQLLILCPGSNGEGFWTYFTDFFNMHKIQPVREYTLYGPGNQKAHVDVDSTLPEIRPPKDIEISQAMREEIMANRERLREQQQAALVLNANKPAVNPSFSRSGSHLHQPPYPTYKRRPVLNPEMRTH